MLEVDTKKMKDYIKKTGLKQKSISEKSGIPEVKLSLILQGKRKCEAGEYASICRIVGVTPEKFMKETKNC